MQGQRQNKLLSRNLLKQMSIVTYGSISLFQQPSQINAKSLSYQTKIVREKLSSATSSDIIPQEKLSIHGNIHIF